RLHAPLFRESPQAFLRVLRVEGLNTRQALGERFEILADSRVLPEFLHRFGVVIEIIREERAAGRRKIFEAARPRLKQARARFKPPTLVRRGAVPPKACRFEFSLD